MSKTARGKTQQFNPGWWILFEVMCGLGAAGLILLIAAPPRGAAIELLPVPSAVPTATLAEQIASTPNVSGLIPTLAALININTATLEELENLPDIGPGLAQAIIDYRDLHGPFTNLEQLDDVSGDWPSDL